MDGRSSCSEPLTLLWHWSVDNLLRLMQTLKGTSSIWDAEGRDKKKRKKVNTRQPGNEKWLEVLWYLPGETRVKGYKHFPVYPFMLVGETRIYSPKVLPLHFLPAPLQVFLSECHRARPLGRAKSGGASKRTWRDYALSWMPPCYFNLPL